MKRSNSSVFLVFLLFVYLLLLLSPASARFMSPIQDEKEVKGVMPEAGLLPEIKEDISDLMGLEKCEEGDEECRKRRVVAEAHLDYIYTQNHKKP